VSDIILYAIGNFRTTFHVILPQGLILYRTASHVDRLRLMKWKALNVLLLVVLVAVACSPQKNSLFETPTTPGATPTPVSSGGSGAFSEPLAGTKWQLVSMGKANTPSPVIAGSTLTLEFRPDGSLGGSAGCNSFSGPYQVQGNTLNIGVLVSTLMACVDEGLMQQETRYLAALQGADSFEIRNNQLVIWYEAGQAQLFFIPAP